MHHPDFHLLPVEGPILRSSKKVTRHETGVDGGESQTDQDG